MTTLRKQQQFSTEGQRSDFYTYEPSDSTFHYFPDNAAKHIRNNKFSKCSKQKPPPPPPQIPGPALPHKKS